MTSMATVYGKSGNDFIWKANGVTDGPDDIFGYGGNDTIKGGGGDDHIYGDAGNPSGTIDGPDGNDTLYGQDGDDWLYGDGGADTLDGGNDDDVLVGGLGADKLDGGDGIDLADYGWGSPEGVTVLLLTGKGKGGDAEGDTLKNIENVGGSNYADTLWGDNNANQLYGQGGDDLIKGFGGADGIFGHDGNDTLYGMDGDDGIMGFSGDDHIVGGQGRDTLWGNGDADTFMWLNTAEAPFVYDPAWDELNFGVDPNSIDRIMDFNHPEGDLINLKAIDADELAAGNQAFTFIGTAEFSGAPGEIRYYQEPTCIVATFLQINTDTDTEAEAMIILEGILAPESDWFVL
jgi:Ca2+-binding RTX toxin-like protein